MLSWKYYNCERCGNDFASPTALKQHFRARHVCKEMCDRCGSEVQREKLQEHEQVAHYEETHGDQKPLVRAAPLRRESRFLASETSVTCRMCRRAFGTSFGREQHERQDHHFTASKRARMSTGFSPNNIVDMRSSQQLRQFVETRLRPESGLMKTACAGEVEALVELIEQCCPVPVSRVVKLAGKPIFFSLLQGLRAVLRLLLRCSELCILWDELHTPYCQGVRRTLLEQTRPFILDPANPTFNVCENCNAWDEVAVVARKSLLKPLLNGVQASGPWLLTDSW
ncbi:UNVERIFIED_CONTAM: hypothetical protein FKN15_054723 [Acipenser sinensis]